MPEMIPRAASGQSSRAGEVSIAYELGEDEHTRRRSVSVQATHGNAKERPHTEKLLVCCAEPGAQFQHNEQDVVDDEGPLSSVAIGSKTKDDTANRSQH